MSKAIQKILPKASTIIITPKKIEKIEQVYTFPNGKCKYKSNTCPYERALKNNGEIHSLCEKHRILHNEIQRKFDHRRRNHNSTFQKKIGFLPKQRKSEQKRDQRVANHHRSFQLPRKKVIQEQEPYYRTAPPPIFQQPFLSFALLSGQNSNFHVRYR